MTNIEAGCSECGKTMKVKTIRFMPSGTWLTLECEHVIHILVDVKNVYQSFKVKG